MKILSVNAGSSSLKFTLLEMKDESVIVSGVFERIGLDNSFYRFKLNGETIKEEMEISNHTEAVNVLLSKLIDLNIISSYDEIKGVGHRILHGGEKYSESVIINDDVIESIKELTPLGPLHHPGEIAGILALKEVLPEVPMVAVYDTAFHQTMDEEAYLYPVPYEWYENYKVRKYGFHGTSHRYIAETVKKLLGKDSFKLISCHIGSGGSICAIKDGKCVDTSMGFTPNAGLIMGTRCGDIDVSIIPYIMSKKGYSKDDIAMLINKESGLVGLTGESDMRDVRKLADEGSNIARTALNMYVDRIVDYIAKYYFELKGVDAIVLTAGVGENNIATRKEILERLDFLGVKIDNNANDEIAGFKEKHEGLITTSDSSIPVYVIPTDEEVMIGRDAYDFAK